MQAILAHGAGKPSQGDIAEIAGVGKRSVSDVISRFEPSGILVGGRPARFGPGAGLALGISVGAQSVRGGLVDANGTIHHAQTAEALPGQLNLPADDLLMRVVEVARSVLAAAFEDPAVLVAPGRLALLGVALAWPSPVDREKRPMGYVLGHGSWTEPDPDTRRVRPIPERLAGHLEKHLGVPFSADRCNVIHNVSAHALCLAFHESRSRTASPGTVAPREGSTMWRVGIVIRLGEQIGATAILLAPPKRQRLSFIESKLIEGTNGLAGEIGHLPVDRAIIDDINKNAVAGLTRIDYAGQRCSCGKTGHLEALANVSALLNRLRRNGEQLDRKARELILSETRGRESDEEGVGDSRALQASMDIGRILGQTLAGPILMLDPWRITLTGPLANERVIRGMLQVGADWGSVVKDSVKIELERDDVADLIGVKGAALAVIRQLVYRNYLDERDSMTPDVSYLGVEELTL